MGHIEDIAVDPKQQGKKLGLRIIQALTGVAEGLGCYKTILDCSKDNIRKFSSPQSSARIHWGPIVSHAGHVHPAILIVRPDALRHFIFYKAFYEKCGFTHKEYEMVSPVAITPPR